jgi:hypothetical protein
MTRGEKDREERGRGGGEPGGMQRIWMKPMNLRGLLQDGGGFMIMGSTPRFVFPGLFPYATCVIDWLCCDVVVAARSVKLIHALPPIPIPLTILLLARFNNTDDHFSEEGTQGMDEFRCRGSYLSPSLPLCCLSSVRLGLLFNWMYTDPTLARSF